MQINNRIIKFCLEVLFLAVLFTLVQYFITTGLLGQYYQINLASMCINIILSVSLNLINGFTGQLSWDMQDLWRWEHMLRLS